MSPANPQKDSFIGRMNVRLTLISVCHVKPYGNEGKMNNMKKNKNNFP
jgi:hypothetical protein